MNDATVATATASTTPRRTVEDTTRALRTTATRALNATRGAAATARADAANWWLVTAQPPSLKTWYASLRGSKLQRVGKGTGKPAHTEVIDSPLLEAARRADHLVIGGALAAASIALVTAAMIARCAAQTPLRRWTLIITAVTLLIINMVTG